MSTKNQVDVGLSGVTGSGMFAGSNSPSFTTPTLGVASATSLNLGGGVLNSYITETTFTPTFTCASPGNLSVSYASRSGWYIRIGNVVMYNISVFCTPTFTTATGQIQYGGLPITPSQSFGDCLGFGNQNSAFVYPGGTNQLFYQTLGQGGNLGLAAFGPGVVETPVNMSAITSGVTFNATFSGFYFV